MIKAIVLVSLAAVLAAAAGPSLYVPKTKDIPLPVSTVMLYDQPYNRLISTLQTVLSTTKARESLIAVLVQSAYMMTAAEQFNCNAACQAKLLASFKKSWPTWYKELVGAAETMSEILADYNVSVTADELAVSAYTYELFHVSESNGDATRRRGEMGCTSILACDANNKIVHGRNLDWPGANMYEDVTARMKFSIADEDGYPEQVLDSIDNFFGASGLITGVTDAFSISLNYRWVKSANTTVTADQIADCLATSKGVGPAGNVIRNALQNYHTYDAAVAYLNSTKFCAPAYLIIGSPDGRGTIIVKGASYMGENYTMTRSLTCRKNMANNDWFLVQTNFDNKTSGVDMMNDTRWYIAENALVAAGRVNATYIAPEAAYGTKGSSGLFRILSTTHPDIDGPACANHTEMVCRGVLNDHTTFTAILDPNKAKIHDNYLRYHLTACEAEEEWCTPVPGCSS